MDGATWPDGAPIDPEHAARAIEHDHRPAWTVWYGKKTGKYWALPQWVSGVLISASTADGLLREMAVFETNHPRPHSNNALYEGWTLGYGEAS